MKQEVNLEMANKAHEEIPGNPSTATSSKQKLNDRSNGQANVVERRSNVWFPIPVPIVAFSFPIR